MKIFDNARIPVLSRAMEVYALRQKTIATNLANITTPGYKAHSVRFEEELTSALGEPGVVGMSTNGQHLSIGSSGASAARPTIVETPVGEGFSGDPLASGVNNVDLDHEMTELAKNQIRFRFAARLMADTFRGIQKSIRGTQ